MAALSLLFDELEGHSIRLLRHLFHIPYTVRNQFPLMVFISNFDVSTLSVVDGEWPV